MLSTLKVVSFLKRRADFTLPAFSEYWRTIHKAHAMKLVEAGFVQGYVQNHRVDVEVDDLDIVADGSPELWIDSVDALRRLVRSPEYRQGAGPDEANFMILPATTCVAREYILREAADRGSLDGALKVMLAFRRRRDLARAAFASCWLMGEGPLLMPDSQPLRLTRQVVVEEGGVAPFDGVECSWWRDPEEFRQAWAGRDQSGARVLMDVSSLGRLTVREEIAVLPASLT